MFRGRVREGLDPRKVRESLGKAYKLTPERLELVFSGQPVSLGSTATRESAEALARKCFALGVVCEVREKTGQEADGGHIRPRRSGAGTDRGVPVREKLPPVRILPGLLDEEEEQPEEHDEFRAAIRTALLLSALAGPFMPAVFIFFMLCRLALRLYRRNPRAAFYHALLTLGVMTVLEMLGMVLDWLAKKVEKLFRGPSRKRFFYPLALLLLLLSTWLMFGDRLVPEEPPASVSTASPPDPGQVASELGEMTVAEIVRHNMVKSQKIAGQIFGMVMRVEDYYSGSREREVIFGEEFRWLAEKHRGMFDNQEYKLLRKALDNRRVFAKVTGNKLDVAVRIDSEIFDVELERPIWYVFMAPETSGNAHAIRIMESESFQPPW